MFICLSITISYFSNQENETKVIIINILIKLTVMLTCVLVVFDLSYICYFHSYQRINTYCGSSHL